ncbi:MAG TPA: DUF4234 domain-containing protein [Candidatus Nanoarchaeia archaeon]|nr:DUF4234 domain-containing protein [Candidatus Nanoarchaeia archaeon]
MENQEVNKVPEKRSVILMLLLCIITLGIYPAIWYIRRAPEFSGLETKEKLSKGLGITLLILSIFSVLLVPIKNFKGFSNPILTYLLVLPENFILLINIIVYLLTITLFLSLAFSARRIMNNALERKGVQRKASWFFTLIFNLYYLQYEVNRIINNTEEEKRIAPWTVFILIFLIISTAGIIYYYFPNYVPFSLQGLI